MMANFMFGLILAWIPPGGAQHPRSSESCVGAALHRSFIGGRNAAQSGFILLAGSRLPLSPVAVLGFLPWRDETPYGPRFVREYGSCMGTVHDWVARKAIAK